MTTRWTLTWLMVVAAVWAMPGAALAHTGGEAPGGFAAGFAHPLGGLDHLLAMVAVGLWAAQLGGRARWVVPVAFLGVMLPAAALGRAGVAVPFAEAAILASVLALGGLIAAGVRWPLAASATVVMLFAVGHGHAHGAEMPLALGGVSYSAGFALATALLHACGVAVSGALSTLRADHLARVAGGAIVIAGLYLAAA